LLCFLGWTLSCNRGGATPDLSYDHANRAFLHGDLKQSQDEAERGYQQFRDSRPEWAARFRILEARAALWRGLYEEVIQLLSSATTSGDQPDFAISALTLTGFAHTYLANFESAQRDLEGATSLCEGSTVSACGEVLQARGFLASERDSSVLAEQFYQRSLNFARSRNDRFLEASSLLNLGDESLTQGHFDEAIERSEAAYQAAHLLDARLIELVAKGNIGWAYYKLGDLENALQLATTAEELAAKLQSPSQQGNYLTNIGYVYMDERKFDLAGRSFQQALDLAQKIKGKKHTYNALRVLARFSLLTGKIDDADHYADQALDIARGSKNHIDELYPLLIQGQVSSRRGKRDVAVKQLQQVEQDPNCPVWLKWEAQHSLARLHEEQKDPDAADRAYRAALATFEAARDTVQHEDLQLSFLTNAARIYDDYVQFLVARGRITDALRWADFNRARTLAQGLGVLSKRTSAEPPPLNAPQIAKHAGGTVLFYWLGETRSYLWAITARNISLIALPSAAEVDAAVQGYRAALGGFETVLLSENRDGAFLYRILVGPVKALLANNDKIFIIPDGSLNNLNFETLLVSEPRPHYWIEDVTITNASSLRLLAASNAEEKKPERHLLLIGNSVSPNPRYPELPKAAMQMESVAAHFPPSERVVQTREQATPAAYLASNPEQFSHIHFVAHGTASRLSPLDSAIILSQTGTQNDSFKLYARDIIRHPLHAELVTISACYGAQGRQYVGEGLVGLSWAFLKAGAHNVIAALWEATDVSTQELMSKFYEELDKGATPDQALRAAKQFLLHDTNYRDPYYWAPFQLYTGSYRNTYATLNR
jgi:CHAT domain-containing protein